MEQAHLPNKFQGMEKDPLLFFTSEKRKAGTCNNGNTNGNKFRGRQRDNLNSLSSWHGTITAHKCIVNNKYRKKKSKFSSTDLNLPVAAESTAHDHTPVCRQTLGSADTAL